MGNQTSTSSVGGLASGAPCQAQTIPGQRGSSRPRQRQSLAPSRAESGHHVRAAGESTRLREREPYSTTCHVSESERERLPHSGGGREGRRLKSVPRSCLPIRRRSAAKRSQRSHPERRSHDASKRHTSSKELRQSQAQVGVVESPETLSVHMLMNLAQDSSLAASLSVSSHSLFDGARMPHLFSPFAGHESGVFPHSYPARGASLSLAPGAMDQPGPSGSAPGRRTVIEDLPHEILNRVLAHVPRASWAAARGSCQSWREAVDSGELTCQRQVNGEGLLEPWAVLVEWKLKGFKDLVPVLRVLDPAKQRWYTLGSLPPMEGFNHTSAMAALGEKMVFLGGTVSQEQDQGTVDILPGAAAWSYHMHTGRTERMPDMIEGRIHCAAGQVQGKLIVAGGTGKGDTPLCTVEEFDAERGTWVRLPDLHTPRAKCFGAEVGGRFWVFSEGAEFEARPSGEVYDPETGMWVVVQGMPKKMGHQVRFELIGNELIQTKDIRPCYGFGTIDALKPRGNRAAGTHLSHGNQMMWCTSSL